jgi:MFS transporter, ACS family, hexuronate transporter
VSAPGGSEPQIDAAVPEPVRERRTLALAGFLLVLMSLQATAQHSFGALAPFIADAFDATGAQMGLVGAALYAGTACGALLLGGWVDRRPPRHVMVVAMVAVGASLAVVAVSRTLVLVVVGYLFVGLARGSIPPLSDRVAYEAAPARRRGLVFGIKQTGSPVGSVSAALILPPIAMTVAGWRTAAIGVAAVIAVVGVVSGRLFGLLVPDPRASVEPADADGGSAGATVPVAGPPLAELGRRLVGPLGFSLGMGVLMAVAVTFLTLFLVDVADVDPVQAGRWLAVFGVGGAAGRMIWGWLSDRLFRGRRTVLLVISAVLGGGMAFLLGVAPSVVLAVPWGMGIGLFGFFVQSWVGILRAWGVESAGRGSSGRAGGLLLGAMMLGGLVGPPVFGLLVDVTESYRIGWIALGGLGCVTGVAMLPAVRAESRRLTAAG